MIPWRRPPTLNVLVLRNTPLDCQPSGADQCEVQFFLPNGREAALHLYEVDIPRLIACLNKHTDRMKAVQCE